MEMKLFNKIAKDKAKGLQRDLEGNKKKIKGRPSVRERKEKEERK